MACPGSLRLCAQVPPLPDSKYSTEGTAAHAVLEQAQRRGSLTLEDCNRDAELYAALRVALDAIEAERARFAHIELFGIEQRVTPLRSDRSTAGTADTIIAGTLADGRRAVCVLDYKHGRNVPVGPGSAQLLAYGLGAADHVGGYVETVRTTVIQPRLQRVKLPPVRSQDHGLQAMHAFAQQLHATCELADTPDAPLNPADKACRWCAAKDICPARAQAPRSVDPDFAAMVGAL